MNLCGCASEGGIVQEWDRLPEAQRAALPCVLLQQPSTTTLKAKQKARLVNWKRFLFFPPSSGGILKCAGMVRLPLLFLFSTEASFNDGGDFFFLAWLGLFFGLLSFSFVKELSSDPLHPQNLFLFLLKCSVSAPSQ